jgi:hypothetical protein
MKTNISNRDWELLSEYIDQQLSPGKQSKLELRIQREPELRSALEDLRRTRYILRSAPRLKAPRNFTLKPHMVPQRKPSRVYPFFQLASAMAAVLLLLVFVGEAFIPDITTPVAMRSPQTEAMPAAVPDQMRAMEQFAAEALVEEANEKEVAESAPPSLAEEAPGAPAIASVPEGDIPPSEPAGEELRLFTEPKILDPDAALVEPAPLDSRETTVSQEGTFLGMTIWRLLQVSLAVIAVSAGLAALYFRRIA